MQRSPLSVISRARLTWPLISFVACVGIAGLRAADDPYEKPKPQIPRLEAASEDAINAIGSFKKPASFVCDVFAAEPMIGNPVAFSIDNRGRVVLCESYRQNKGVTDNRGHDSTWVEADLAAMTVSDRIRYHRELLADKAIEYETQDDLLRLLVDSDGDFHADKATVFASGFNAIEEGTGAGALIRGNRVYYTNIPKLWALVDQDNDGVADERIVMSDGYGVRVAFRGHDMHGLILGPDGRLYFSIGDRGYHIQTPDGLIADPESGAVFRCELDGSKLEVYATGLRNPQELAFDDFGNLFTGDNNSDSGDKARWVYLVPGSDSGWRMMYQYISDRGPFNREKIWWPFHEETPAYTVPPIANVADGPSGLTCYPGTGLTTANNDDLQFANAFFLCDFRGQASNSGVRMLKVKPKGAFFELTNNEPFIWNVLATDVDFGPDGGLYVSDWINGWNGENKGRIYRFADEAAQSSAIVRNTRSLLNEGMTHREVSQLVELLSHQDRRVRLEAQWELVSRQQSQSLATASNAATSSVLKRLHATWGLGQLLRANVHETVVADALKKCLMDSEPIVVARAVQALADAGRRDAAPLIAKLLQHESPLVRSAVCFAIGQFRDSQSLAGVIKVVSDNNNQDPIVRHAGIMALAGIMARVDNPNDETVLTLKSHASEAVRLAAVVALRKQANPIISEFLTDSSSVVIKEAVRAIHDVPALHSQLPQIAALPMTPKMDEVIIHRVLNAAFRLGRNQDAARLADYAATADSNESMRLESLTMLARWPNPGKLDRVMNRYQPLENRDRAIATNVLRERIKALSMSPERVRDKFLEVGATLGLKEISPLLMKTVLDSNAAGTRRAAAIRAVGSLDSSAIQDSLKELLLDKDVDVRLASLAIQVQIAPNNSLSYLKSAINSDTLRERQFGWDQLALLSSDESKEWIANGVQGILDGTLARDCWINVLDAAEGKLSQEQSQKLEARRLAYEPYKESDPKKYYEECIDGGDVDRGRVLFFTRSNLSCVRCHKVGNTGGEVGPNLSELGTKKGRDYLLEAIVAPNAVIAQGFETVMVIDDDGSAFSGILKAEDDKWLTLLDAQGDSIRIAKNTIENRKKGQSSMPVDLIKYLTKRELRDLVAYLGSLDGTPITTAGPRDNEGGHKER